MKRQHRNRNFSPRAAVIRLMRPNRDAASNDHGTSPRSCVRPGEILASANRAARRIAAGADAAAETVATVAARLAGPDGHGWHAFVAETIAAWGAGYFDDGPAGRRSPWWGQAPYAAWRGEAELDRTPELLGVRGFCAIARTLPRDADGLLLRAAQELGMSGELFEAYCLQLLQTVPAPLRFECERARSAARAMKDVMAIRAAWDIALLDAFAPRNRDVAGDLRRDLAGLLARDVDAAPALLRRA